MQWRCINMHNATHTHTHVEHLSFRWPCFAPLRHTQTQAHAHTLTRSLPHTRKNTLQLRFFDGIYEMCFVHAVNANANANQIRSQTKQYGHMIQRQAEHQTHWILKRCWRWRRCARSLFLVAHTESETETLAQNTLSPGSSSHSLSLALFQYWMSTGSRFIIDWIISCNHILCVASLCSKIYFRNVPTLTRHIHTTIQSPNGNRVNAL